MVISPFLFYIFAGLALGCATLVVLKKNPVASAFNLIMVLFAIAAIYALMGAHLIAGLQVLVSAGAVMVLFIFVIMLLNADTPSFDFARSHLLIKALGTILLATIFGLFIWIFKNAAPIEPKGPFSLDAVAQSGGNSKVLAKLMFSDYILPFELTSVLLLTAIVGVVAIAMRKKRTE